VPPATFLLDCDLIIVAVKGAYCPATMAKREEMLGRGVVDVFLDNPDDRATTRNWTAPLRVLE
jgi:PAS domain-containing protein